MIKKKKRFLQIIVIVLLIVLGYKFFITYSSQKEIIMQNKYEVNNPYHDVAFSIIKDANAITDEDKVIAVNNWFGQNFIFPSEKEVSYNSEVLFNLRVGMCQSMAIFMKKILNEMKIKSRVISIFNIDNSETLDSHAVLEVFYDNSWHLFDPNYSLYYIDSKSLKNVLSLNELMTIQTKVEGVFYNVWRRKKLTSNLVMTQDEFLSHISNSKDLVIHKLFSSPELYKKLKYSTIFYDNSGYSNIYFNQAIKIGEKGYPNTYKWSDLLPRLTGREWFGNTTDNEKRVLRLYFDKLNNNKKYMLTIDFGWMASDNTQILISKYDAIVNKKVEAFKKAGDSNDTFRMEFQYDNPFYVELEVISGNYVYLDALELEEIK